MTNRLAPWPEYLPRDIKSEEVMRAEGSAGFMLEGPRFRSSATRFFAYVSTPVKSKPGAKVPAVILCHGGGGHAFQAWTEQWAAAGYLAIAPDFSARGLSQEPLPDGGPNQEDPTKFGFMGESLNSHWCYLSLDIIARCVAFLKTNPQCDATRVGIVGVSWGGFLTCLARTLIPGLSAACSVYGCGYLHHNSRWLPIFEAMSAQDRERWISLYDPSNYLGESSVPMFFVSGTNDMAYPLDSLLKSISLCEDSSTVRIGHEMIHSHPAAWNVMEIFRFFDFHFKAATPLPENAKLTFDETTGFSTRTSISPIKAELWTQSRAEENSWQCLDMKVSDRDVTAAWTGNRPPAAFCNVFDTAGSFTSSLLFNETKVHRS